MAETPGLDFELKDNSPTPTAGARLLNPKYASIYLPSSDKPVGLMQSVTITVGYTTERAMEIGSTFMLPVSGRPILTVTARRLLVPENDLLVLVGGSDTDPFDLVKASKKGKLAIGNVKIQFEVPNPDGTTTKKDIIVHDLTISSWSSAYDSGSVFVFEDVVLEGSMFETIG
jgi:hypothetical protein